MREHGVDAVARRAAVAGGAAQDAVDDAGDPVVAGDRLDGRHRQAGRGERFARCAQFCSTFGSVAVEQLVFQIAVAVEQQSLDEKCGQRLCAASVEPLADFAERVAETRGKRVLAVARRYAGRGGKGRLQFAEAHAAVGLHGDHRHAESLGERRDVDLDLPIAGHVDHVERHDGRQAER